MPRLCLTPEAAAARRAEIEALSAQLRAKEAELAGATNVENDQEHYITLAADFARLDATLPVFGGASVGSGLAPGYYNCGICASFGKATSWPSRHKFEIHYVMRHLPQSAYLCDKCPLYSKAPKELATHAAYHVGPAPEKAHLNCPDCTWFGSSLGYGTNHKVVHLADYKECRKILELVKTLPSPGLTVASQVKQVEAELRRCDPAFISTSIGPEKAPLDPEGEADSFDPVTTPMPDEEEGPAAAGAGALPAV
jgi:hypothetical protein